MAVTKRKFRNVAGSKKVYRPWSRWEEGDVFVGKFLGENGVDDYGKTQWLFEIEEVDFADGDDHEKFEDNIGKECVFNSNGLLDKTLDDVSEGSTIRIEYLGKETMTKHKKYKGKKAHSLSIGVADSEDDDAGI